MQGIYARLTGGSICLPYICIVLDLALVVVVCKTSVLNYLGGLDLAVGVANTRHLCSIDWGVHLPSIYMHCTISSSGCSGMQGICTQLTGGSICLLYICTVLDLVVGVVVCKASVFD